MISPVRLPSRQRKFLSVTETARNSCNLPFSLSESCGVWSRRPTPAYIYKCPTLGKAIHLKNSVHYLEQWRKDIIHFRKRDKKEIASGFKRKGIYGNEWPWKHAYRVNSPVPQAKLNFFPLLLWSKERLDQNWYIFAPIKWIRSAEILD